MQALVLHEVKTMPVLEERPDLTPGPGEVVVRLKAAALNRRDYWITQGLYPGMKLPVVLGSDGAGVVSALGDGVAEEWKGREVIINPGLDWGDEEAAQSDRFHILGLPWDGTFATEVKVPASALRAKPAHLNWRDAAALPLAGVTAYRALFVQGKLQAGERVLVTGIGGGVATFALQYAVAAGAEVYVTSSSPEKIERAVKLGAKGGFNYTSEDWAARFKSEVGSPQLIIDSAGGPGYAQLIDLVAPGGRIVNYGATVGPPKSLDLFKVFWKQLHLIGSTMGSQRNFDEMLRFVEQQEITPVVDEVLPLAKGADALRRMEQSSQFGKIVLEIEP